jgi:hypothetical protein
MLGFPPVFEALKAAGRRPAECGKMDYTEHEDERGAYLIVTANKGRERFLIDAADREVVENTNWTVLRESEWLAYVGRTVEKTTLLLHRHLMNTPKKLVVDHRDDDGLNCRRYNLRNCTKAQNDAKKRTLTKLSASGARGVYPTKNGRFTVIVSLDNKLKSHGTFDTIAEASAVRDAVVLAHYGEYAVLNNFRPADGPAVAEAAQ